MIHGSKHRHFSSDSHGIFVGIHGDLPSQIEHVGLENQLSSMGTTSISKQVGSLKDYRSRFNQYLRHTPVSWGSCFLQDPSGTPEKPGPNGDPIPFRSAKSEEMIGSGLQPLRGVIGSPHDISLFWYETMASWSDPKTPSCVKSVHHHLRGSKSSGSVFYLKNDMSSKISLHSQSNPGCLWYPRRSAFSCAVTLYFWRPLFSCRTASSAQKSPTQREILGHSVLASMQVEGPATNTHGKEDLSQHVSHPINTVTTAFVRFGYV